MTHDLTSATSFEYRRNFAEDGETVTAAGIHHYETQIADVDLGDETVLIHEIAHVIQRHRHGMDAEVHGSEFIGIKDTLRVALGHGRTGDMW